MREREVEDALVRLAAERGWWAVKFRVLGVAGFPDRMVLAAPGRVAFVELKRPGKLPRPLQRLIHRRLRRLGFIVVTLDTIEGVERFVDGWRL